MTSKIGDEVQPTIARLELRLTVKFALMLITFSAAIVRIAKCAGPIAAASS